MTTTTAPPTQEERTFEVAYKEPNTLPEIAVTAITAALAVAGLMLAGASAYGIWVLRGWLQAGCVGGVMLGLLLALRFTRDDRNIIGEFIGLRLDLADAQGAVTKRNNEIRILHNKLAKAQRPIHVYERGKEREVEREPRNDAWHNAVMLVKSAEDYGQLLGRKQTKLSQPAQSAATELLLRLGLIEQNGYLSSLLVTCDTALAQLGALDLSGLADKSSPEVATSLQVSESGAGEGSDDDD